MMEESQINLKITPVMKAIAIALVVGALLGAALSFYYTNRYWTERYNALKTEFDAYQVTHPDQSNSVKTEEAIIKEALRRKEEKEPVEEKIVYQDRVVVEYVEKESPQDVDVQIQNDPVKIAVSYNGKVEELKGSPNEKQKFENGKLVVDQTNVATIDIDSIVNREIANKVLEYEHMTQVKDRQKKQVGWWSGVGGFAAGYAVGRFTR